jgi:hypothetical protein
MSVQPSPQPLLIEVMRNQTNRTSQNEQSVQNAHLHVVLGLFSAESTAVAHQVDEADGDAAVDVEDQVVLFGGGDSFDSNGIVEHLAGWEALLDKLFDEFDTEIGVVARFDFVANAWD